MRTPLIRTWIASVCLFLALLATPRAVARDVKADCEKLRAAISDLTETFPDRYPNAPRYVHRPFKGGYVGDLELHFDAKRLLFTQSSPAGWKIQEMNTDGSHIPQVSRMPDDVDAMDPCYLPSGPIVFGSTSSYQSVPCWHGWQPVSNLHVMDADGSHVRQLCFDRPARCRSSFRLAYPAWQRVFNVGFRVVVVESRSDSTNEK